MKITVLIPTYRRPQNLARCLDALKRQERSPDYVLVTMRDGDVETNSFLDAYDPAPLPLTVVRVAGPGVVAAMNAGLNAADGDVLALTDDDTAPHRDWLKQIEAHFAVDSGGRLAGVGGRDWQAHEMGRRPAVGLVQWHGRVVGNHHLGCGPARAVDVLKGANCAYRLGPLRAVGFDTRLRGGGAQPHWELALCLALKGGGWSLLYDPAVGVDHFVAPRFDADQNLRGTFNAEGIRDAAYNETLALLTHLPPVRRAAFLLWAVLVGTAGDPGLAQVPRLILRRERRIWERTRAALSGRVAAVADRRGQRPLRRSIAVG